MGAIIRLEERHARAYVAEPDAAAHGRVLVIHDAYGLLPHVRFLCDELAAHGFVAVAPDLFAGANTRSDSEASRLLETLTTARAERVLEAALTTYDLLGHTDGPDAAIGFSIGAEFGFGLAIRGRLHAIVTYYGLPSDEHRSHVAGPLLAHWAEHDRWDDDESPGRLLDELRERNVDVVSHTYAGTRHGFGNADIAAFDLDAAEQAWGRTLDFLNDRLAAA
ncbi:dienelactone hydrolase family protein [soil metagenome]